MRDRTQGRIEELAAERDIETIDLPHVEEGIELGLQMMKEMMSSFGAQPAATPPTDAKAADADSTESTPKEVCPVAHGERGKVESLAEKARLEPLPAPPSDEPPHPLNEVSVMSELEQERQRLDDADA